MNTLLVIFKVFFKKMTVLTQYSKKYAELIDYKILDTTMQVLTRPNGSFPMHGSFGNLTTSNKITRK